MIVFCFQESDSQFRYIALELCIGTLTDYIEKKVTCSTSAIDLLSQAMSGLSHLHSLGIGKYSTAGYSARIRVCVSQHFVKISFESL